MDFLKQPEIIGVIKGQSSKHGRIQQRPSSAFIYKVGGESIYHFRDKDVHFTDGTILFVPQGESYTFDKITEGNYCLVNFSATYETPSVPHLFTLSESERVLTLFKQLEQSQRLSGNITKKYEALSLFYRILSILSANEVTTYSSREQKERIQPAISYLEKHIFDSNLRISILSVLCNVSEPFFRKTFTSRFGTSPKKYIIQERMKHAKMALESGEYESIADIAKSVGYDDPLYFSRHFKEYYGFTPSALKH